MVLPPCKEAPLHATTICCCYDPAPLAMQVDQANDIEEIELSPPPHDVIPPIEIIWDDDKIEKVRIVCCLDWNVSVASIEP